jgi:hypothetical protein
MPTDSNSPAAVAANQNEANQGRYLIPPFQRRRFCIQFTFMTILGWVGGGIASIALEQAIINNLPMMIAENAIAANTITKTISSVGFAVIFALAQAFVLRRYLSSGLWMLATSVGWLLANSVSTAWINYILSTASSINQGLSADGALFWGFLSTFSYILSGIWLGMCQWSVLRLYAAAAWRWNFIPSIAFVWISFLVWLLSLLPDMIPAFNQQLVLYIIGQFFTAMILGIVPAMGLCSLLRK